MRQSRNEFTDRAVNQAAKQSRARWTLSFLCLAFLTTVGCQTAPETTEPTPLAYPVPDRSPLIETACLSGDTFEPIDADTLIKQASAADIVLIGELHGNAQGLAAATALWQGILENKPNAVLALEFIERDQQIKLDDWLDLETPIKPEGFSAKHLPMLLTAKAQNRPVIAANAPRRYVKLARKKGNDYLAGRTAAQQATFVFPEDLMPGGPDGGYKDRFFKMFSGEGHGHTLTPEKVEGYWRAQSMWDATMADSVVRVLAPDQSPIVLVVGRFHVKDDGGTLQLIRAQKPDAKIFTVIMSNQEEVDKAQEGSDAPPAADAIWLLDPAE